MCEPVDVGLTVPVARDYRYRCTGWMRVAEWLPWAIFLTFSLSLRPGTPAEIPTEVWAWGLGGCGLVTAWVWFWSGFRLRRRRDTRALVHDDGIETVDLAGRRMRAAWADVTSLRRRLLFCPAIVVRATGGATVTLDPGFEGEEEMLGSIAARSGLTYDSRPWQRLLGVETWSQPSSPGEHPPGVLALSRFSAEQVTARLRLRRAVNGVVWALLVSCLFWLPARTLEDAVMLGRPWRVRAHLMLGADPDESNLDSRPLYFAVSCRSLAIAQMLLDAGADPDGLWAPGDPGYAPLIGAVSNNDADAVRLLLRYGADPAIAPFDMGGARQLAGPEVRALLKAAGAGDESEEANVGSEHDAGPGLP